MTPWLRQWQRKTLGYCRFFERGATSSAVIRLLPDPSSLPMALGANFTEVRTNALADATAPKSISLFPALKANRNGTQFHQSCMDPLEGRKGRTVAAQAKPYRVRRT
ncbi:hypothetical protein, partial [Endothiovibrio diazotrophicus]